MKLADRIAAARGSIPADLVLKNLYMVNVYSGEIYPTEIAIKDGLIIGLGEGYTGAQTIDLGGRYVAPGLIDAHVHIESSMCIPPEFSHAALTLGVTTVITDPHEIANVMGLDGIRYMLTSAENGLMSMFVMASSCVPVTPMAHAGAALEANDLQDLLHHPSVIGLAEMMNYPGTVNADPDVVRKLETFQDLVIDGHAPNLRGLDLNAYVAAGVASDHECTTVEEAREKLQKGMMILIREATNAHNLIPLLPLITPENSRRLCFCTDDRHPGNLLHQGSIDYMIRVAIREGELDPMTAIRMGTLNTAEYFRLHDRGGIAPGKRADLFVFSDLQAPRAEQVYVGGQLVAENGLMVAEIPHTQQVQPPSSVHIKWEGLDFRIPAQGRRIRVIGSIPDQLVTEHCIEDATIENGCAVADVKRDILKMVVIERHHATGQIGKGFIHGIGLTHGAIAGTVAHDHHNLVIIGADDVSMMTAAKAVERLGGGLVAVDGERVLAELPLPIAGVMSTAPIEDVSARLENLLQVTRQELGSPLHDPFMAMGFMALEVIPSLKLTDIGLVDVEQFKIVDLFVD